jgi:eight-cysteine-cluster-containing protein
MMRRYALSCLFLVAALPACDNNVEATDPAINEYDDELGGKSDRIATTSTFYQARADLRRCVDPLCGGLWVKRVGRKLTKCADGKYANECYVPRVDLSAVGLNEEEQNVFATRFEANRGLVRGYIKAQTYGTFGNLGVLVAQEAWDAQSDADPVGTTYAVNDNGKRCFTFPCYSLHAAELNQTYSKDFSDLNLSQTGASDEAINAAYEALGKRVLVTGSFKKVYNAGPAGTALHLNATAFYLPAQTKGAAKCVVSGCSGQICASEPMVSTCEWREEYACYQTAECTVQADGQCGWTQTPELTSCLGGGSTTCPGAGSVNASTGKCECLALGLCIDGFTWNSDPSVCGCEPTVADKCHKTGCSGQICADHDVITTCIFLEEYACYQTAECKTQADGNCGFTQTAELTQCLANN